MYRIMLSHRGSHESNRSLREVEVVEDRWIAERVIKRIAAGWAGLTGKLKKRSGHIEFTAGGWGCAVYIERIVE